MLNIITEPDPLLDEAETARQLNVKPGTLQVWRATQRYPLAYVKVGRVVRYRQSAIRRFIDERTVAA